MLEGGTASGSDFFIRGCHRAATNLGLGCDRGNPPQPRRSRRTRDGEVLELCSGSRASALSTRELFGRLELYDPNRMVSSL